jgi:hypothetical protein
VVSKGEEEEEDAEEEGDGQGRAGAGDGGEGAAAGGRAAGERGSGAAAGPAPPPRRLVQMRGVGASAEIDQFPLIDLWARLARRLGVDIGRPAPPTAAAVFSAATGELARPSDLLRHSTATSRSATLRGRAAGRVEYVERLRASMKVAFLEFDADEEPGAAGGGSARTPTSAAGRMAKAKSLRTVSH